MRYKIALRNRDIHDGDAIPFRASTACRISNRSEAPLPTSYDIRHCILSCAEADTLLSSIERHWAASRTASRIPGISQFRSSSSPSLSFLSGAADFTSAALPKMYLTAHSVQVDVLHRASSQNTNGSILTIALTPFSAELTSTLPCLCQPCVSLQPSSPLCRCIAIPHLAQPLRISAHLRRSYPSPCNALLFHCISTRLPSTPSRCCSHPTLCILICSIAFRSTPAFSRQFTASAGHRNSTQRLAFACPICAIPPHLYAIPRLCCSSLHHASPLLFSSAPFAANRS